MICLWLCGSRLRLGSAEVTLVFSLMSMRMGASRGASSLTSDVCDRKFPGWGWWGTAWLESESCLWGPICRLLAGFFISPQALSLSLCILCPWPAGHLDFLRGGSVARRQHGRSGCQRGTDQTWKWWGQICSVKTAAVGKRVQHERDSTSLPQRPDTLKVGVH